jgi:methyl-accepting chemotaxis protein
MTPQPPTEAPGRGRRKLRNYLLDGRFQLKFAAYFVVLTLGVAGLLGVFLVLTTDSLFREMNGAVDARSKAAETNRELGTCSLNSELTKNLDNPGFTAQLAERSKAIDEAFEAEKQAVMKKRSELVDQQRLTIAILVALLVGFVVLVALGSLVITHHIVGPLFRIKRMAREVASGMLRPPTYGLRPGDELQDVFEVFSSMIKTLREQSEGDLRTLEAAVAGDLEALRRLKVEYEARLAKK